MAPEKKLSRRRCTICRNAYRPHPRAQLTQKTCSAQCRRKRRQRAAKRRRSKNLEAYRSAERKRQQRRRSRARTASAENATLAKAKPGRDESQPARDESQPARDEAQPARDEAQPCRDEAQPCRDEAQPARDEAQPARDAAKPARDPGRLSRAGLAPQLSRLIKKIVDSVDKQLQASRADFERGLLEIIEETGRFVGQVGQKRADVTPPAYFLNPLKSKEKQTQIWDEMSRAGIDKRAP